MHHTSAVHRSLYLVFEPGRRLGPVDSGIVTPLPQGGLTAHPHDVVYGQLVAENSGDTLIYVQQGSQSGKVQAEEVQECRVLTERIGVVLVVHPGLVVAQEQEKALLAVVLHVSNQAGPPLDIGLS